MAAPFAVARVRGDNDRRGSDSTSTRIFYHSPPPRDSIELPIDGADYRHTIYGRGVTSVLKTTIYPPDATFMKIYAANSRKSTSLHLEPRFTPPDCSDAQDLASGKAAILDRQAKLAQQPRRDSGVSAEQDSALEPLAGRNRIPASPKRSRSLEDDASDEAPLAKSPRAETKQKSSTRKSESRRSSSKSARKAPADSSVNNVGPVAPGVNVSEESIPSSSRLSSADDSATAVAPLPSKANFAEENDHVSSVIPTIETHVRADEPPHVAPPRRGARRARIARREDLTIDANFGTLNDASGPRMREFRQGSHWYRVAAETTPEWAEQERPIEASGSVAKSRNSTARAKT